MHNDCWIAVYKGGRTSTARIKLNLHEAIFEAAGRANDRSWATIGKMVAVFRNVYPGQRHRHGLERVCE